VRAKNWQEIVLELDFGWGDPGAVRPESANEVALQAFVAQKIARPF
jgi:hypothetical protein